MPHSRRHPMVTAERLRELLDYDPETGIFRWRESRGPNRRGDRAGNWVPEKNHRQVTIDARPYAAHRLAWLYVHGDLPAVVDHRNGDRSDNRIDNLRPA